MEGQCGNYKKNKNKKNPELKSGDKVTAVLRLNWLWSPPETGRRDISQFGGNATPGEH